MNDFLPLVIVVVLFPLVFVWKRVGVEAVVATTGAAAVFFAIMVFADPEHATANGILALVSLGICLKRATEGNHLRTS